MSKFVRGLKLIGGNLKNIWKGNKTGKGLIIFTALLMIGGCSGEESYTPEQYDEMVSGYEQQIEDLEKEVDEQKGYVKNWKDKINDLESKTKDYLDLDDNEKEIVDAKIVEVNKATEEQIAAEKAQKEAEEEARRQAEEEAKKQAEEEERLRKEEEERQRAEEEAKKQEEQRKATEYANVVKTAKNYLSFMAFSRKGLIDQLVYEGYSQESAEYAVDNIGADWNQQCANKAKDYLEFMSFSRDGLYQQLAYEGFTDEQIQYGLSQVGY